MVIDEYTFIDAANTTLYVPVGCVDVYSAADGWKDFKEIKEIGSVPSGIEHISEDDGTAIKTQSDNWYDLSGRKLQSTPIQKGIYIINGRKVVIK